MQKLFTWDSSLATGDQTIDDQHRRIIELANEILTNLTPEDIKLRVLELYRHTREHFQYEEELMRNRNYPDFQKHQNEHNDMIDQINELVASFESTSADCARLQQFVVDWIEGHVFHLDKQLIEFLTA